MATEQVRQCGYRKVGGLYLCGAGLPLTCDRLPYELIICPACGGGIKFTRGWTWLDWRKYAGEHVLEPNICKCVEGICPVCYPYTDNQPYGLLWCGEQFYTPEAFIQEAIQMGVSRRIAAVPKNLKLGETWILFAHKNVETVNVSDTGSKWELEEENKAAVFYAFRPQSLELLIWNSEATEE